MQPNRMLPNRSRTSVLVFLLPPLLLYGAAVLFPILQSLFLSFFSWNGISDMEFVGVDNYVRMFVADDIFWRAFLTSLKDRGLSGVQLVISDQHAGLVAALKRSFQGTAHQRCRVHFARNLLALVPKSHTDMVAAVFRTIFAQPDADTVAATWDQVRDQLGDRFPKIAALISEAQQIVAEMNTGYRDPAEARALFTGLFGENRGRMVPAATRHVDPSMKTTSVRSRRRMSLRVSQPLRSTSCQAWPNASLL